MSIIIPFTCGFLESVFFSTTHYCVKSKGAKDVLMISHLFFDEVVFIPTAFLNIFCVIFTSLNSFCVGTMIPVVFTMINRRKRHHKIKHSDEE